MASVSPGRGEAQALKVFRLLDVPEHVRVRAALEHADEINRALKQRGAVQERRPVHRDEFMEAVDRNAAVMQVAMFPRDHVYAVSQAAWDRMLAEAAAGRA